jgi:peptide/nickel transport system ATP-binding protein
MNSAAIAVVEGLSIADGGGHDVLSGVSLAVGDGERIGIVGESGAGKTTLALALLGAIRPGLRHRAGQVRIAGHEMINAPAPLKRALRRQTIAYLPQDPTSALTPTMRVGAQVAELADDPTPDAVTTKLQAVGLPTDRVFQRSYPHQLSGGQRQRLALARTLAGDPKVLVLDEPTTGLDVHARDTVLTEIDRLARAAGMALIVISHDLIVIAHLAERLAALHNGRLVEHGPTVPTLRRPEHPCTADVVDASSHPVVARQARRPAGDNMPALEVRALCAKHGRDAASTVADVSFTVRSGSCVALVGASGCGKTTIARCLAGLHAPTAGMIRVNGQPVAGLARRRPLAQRRQIQLISQDPVGSLNPRRIAQAMVARPLRRLYGFDRRAADAEALQLLERVGLDGAAMRRRPRALSGGECQRVAIARALAARPDVLICDEVTSALDARMQTEILRLLDDLRRELDVALILITHDLAVAAAYADHVLVLDDGRVCESGAARDVLTQSSHPITQKLQRASTALADTVRKG